MPAKTSPDLRKAPKKRAVAVRKDEPLEIEQFLSRWQPGLKKRGVLWEGPRAVTELQRKEMYEFLLCEQAEYHAKILANRMVEEINAYEVEARGRLAKEHFDEVSQFLRSELERVQAKEDGTTVPSLKALLERLKTEVERTRKTVGTLKQQRLDWHFGAWGYFWPEIPRRNLVSRKIELDTRLQVELGKILADYLRPEDEHERVSLETIARLILLAYLVGELAMEDKKTGTVRTNYTDRVLTVRNIRENLRYAHLHEAESFRSG